MTATACDSRGVRPLVYVPADVVQISLEYCIITPHKLVVVVHGQPRVRTARPSYAFVFEDIDPSVNHTFLVNSASADKRLDT
jgi:hypothetical protein